jgi:iron complex transport system substrate-binding protein
VASLISRRTLRPAIVALAIVAANAGWPAGRAATPSRIVSTSPSITETLFALGLGDRVVGVSTFCRFPLEVQKLPKVGTFLQPDAELIAGLRPDLVVIHEKANGIDRRLASLHIPFVVVDRGSTQSVFTSIRQIGAAAGVPDRATALVAAIERKLGALRAANRLTSRPRVLFIIGRRSGMLADLVGVGAGTYLNDLIEIGGGTNVLNISGQPEYPRISMETVLRFDPDVIVDTVDMGAQESARVPPAAVERLWSAYPTLTAVKTKRVYAATIDALVVPGPRIVEAAEWVSELLHRQPRP